MSHFTGMRDYVRHENPGCDLIVGNGSVGKNSSLNQAVFRMLRIRYQLRCVYGGEAIKKESAVDITIIIAYLR